jgi:hypothetical protein
VQTESQELLEKTPLPELISDAQREIYQRVIRDARARGIRFALGGGFAVNTYTHRWRDTKDLDLYIRPQDQEAMIDLLTSAGLSDYYDQLPYDRAWIYRGYSEGTIVDIIWEMANYRAQVDELWLTRGPEADFCGELVRLLPAEEMIWSKIHVLQRDRCDLPDVLNLIYAVGATLDWEHLLRRLANDAPLLGSALLIFTWLCPGRAQAFPLWLWERLQLPAPPLDPAPECHHCRVDLLDSRPWFGPTSKAEPTR